MMHPMSERLTASLTNVPTGHRFGAGVSLLKLLVLPGIIVLLPGTSGAGCRTILASMPCSTRIVELPFDHLLQ